MGPDAGGGAGEGKGPLAGGDTGGMPTASPRGTAAGISLLTLTPAAVEVDGRAGSEGRFSQAVSARQAARTDKTTETVGAAGVRLRMVLTWGARVGMCGSLGPWKVFRSTARLGLGARQRQQMLKVER